MIITSYSNIDLIQGVIGYGNATEGITDWRIENTGAGIFNINNSSSIIRPSGGTTEIGQITNSTDRYMIFKGGTSTFTVPVGGIVCDILVVGGGGGGGDPHGGGGGAGQLVFIHQATLNGEYTVKVGNGGTGGIAFNSPATKGNNSEFGNSSTIVIAEGGGANSSTSSDKNGGSGAGGDGYTGTGGTSGAGNAITTIDTFPGATVYTRGNNGGNEGGDYRGGGGGGAGEQGQSGSFTIPGKGGDGLSGITAINYDFQTNFGNFGRLEADGKYYFAGGGGGGNTTVLNSSKGGGGAGGIGNVVPGNLGGNGVANTGSGGGAGGGNNNANGGAGGSGIVIIRYSTTNISIIDNGNVGISTTPISSSSKLEIYGDINISGNYKLNNRDVINDTSNYILTTSNLLVPRIITEVGHGSNYVSRINTQLNTRIDDTSNYVARTSTFLANNVSSQWTNVSSGIHFTPTPSLLSITSSPIATTIGTTGDYTYMVFTYTTETAGAGTGQSLYTINVPTGGAICDILIVGGGGSGSESHGGGGGAGAVIFMTNVNMNGNYTIKVGKGGVCQVTNGLNGVGNKGKDTEIFKTNNISNKVVAEGGGGGGAIAASANGGSGGSGGGGDAYNVAAGIGGIATPYTPVLDGVTGIKYGNNGGNAFGNPGHGGGGGGAGGAGENALAGYNSGNTEGERAHGGVGIKSATINSVNYDFKTLFGTNTGGGVLEADGFLYFGGGGGNGRWNYLNNNEGGNGGLGGGGKGGWGTSGVTAPLNGKGYPGINGTGGGGGGGGDNTPAGGDGGSGIVIIRFLSSTRNVGIGTTNPTSELHVYDDTTTNTKLTVQNNFVEPIVLSPNTIGYTVAETLESNKFYRTITFTYNLYYPELEDDTKNLFAWYKLDGNLIDSSRGTGTATLPNGAITYSTNSGILSNFPNYQSAVFNGTASAIGAYALTPVIYKNVPLSFAFWFMTTGTEYYTIMGYGDKSANTPKIQFDFNLQSGSSYRLVVYTALNNTWTISPTATGLSLNTWYFCVYTLSNTNPVNCVLYINGLQRATGVGNTGQYLLTTKDLTIGGSGDGGRGFVGQIADVRIYNKVLSLAEIGTLYNINTPNSIVSKIKFRNPTTVFVNGGSANTVVGVYNISVGPVNSSVLPGEGQTIIPFPSSAATSISIKYEYKDPILSLPNLISVVGATTTTIGTTDRCILFPYTADTIANSGQTEYTFSPTEKILCDILLVGGGGGGGSIGGSGGGGDVLEFKDINLNPGNYKILVGRGGISYGGTISTAESGKISSMISVEFPNKINLKAGGGGGGSAYGAWQYGWNYGWQLGSPLNNDYFTTYIDPNTGETKTTSGGGGGTRHKGTSGSVVLNGITYGGNGNGVSGYGGVNDDNNEGSGGAGGGAAPPSQGGNGGNSSYGGGTSYTGNGGKGIISYITGTSIEYGGGGAGASQSWPPTSQGSASGGGGYQRGFTSIDGSYSAIYYSPENGKGGGGIMGRDGSSGIVIIRYRRDRYVSSSFELITAKQLPNELVVSGTSSTSTGTFDRCIVFPYTTETISGSGQTQYNFSINEELICDILVVAGGGGGGGQNAGGGGAGGLVLVQNITLFGNFTINVGNGGSGRTGDTSGLPGINSTLTKSDNSIIITANGGGRGGNTFDIGGNGGSGGGGGFVYSNGTQTQKSQSQIGIVSPTILNQYGENGGHGGSGVGNSYPGGGGGGAGGVGSTSPGDETGQNGGLGIDRVGDFIFKEKFNSSVGDYGWFAGGGGSAGGYQNTNYAYGNGGATMFGGGGNGDGVGRGINGINGTGGGGGGARLGAGGGRGGSGIVIIRYRSTKIGYQGYNIGNYNGDFKIISTNSSTNTDFMRITRDGASIYNPTGTPLWSTVSDRRIKENIEIASYDKCYESINKLELYRFNYIKELNNINKDIVQLGYIAQEVKDIFPKAVSTQEFYNENLSISDMLSIDITQINYSLYGAVKKLIEMYNDIEKQITILENILNIDNTNLTLDTSTSNLIFDTTTSNVSLDTSNSNLTLDTTTSNLTLDKSTSNITVDTSTSNVSLDTSNSNITVNTSTSNLTFDTTTSNLTLDTTTSNISLDTSNSNIIFDTYTSNIILDTTTSNLSN